MAGAKKSRKDDRRFICGVDLGADLHQATMQFAKREDRTLSSVFRMALRQFLAHPARTPEREHINDEARHVA